MLPIFLPFILRVPEQQQVKVAQRSAGRRCTTAALHLLQSRSRRPPVQTRGSTCSMFQPTCTSAARRNLHWPLRRSLIITSASRVPRLEPKASALAQSTPRPDSLVPRPAAQHRVSFACPMSDACIPHHSGVSR